METGDPNLHFPPGFEDRVVEDIMEGGLPSYEKMQTGTPAVVQVPRNYMDDPWMHAAGLQEGVDMVYHSSWTSEYIEPELTKFLSGGSPMGRMSARVPLPIQRPTIEAMSLKYRKENQDRSDMIIIAPGSVGKSTACTYRKEKQDRSDMIIIAPGSVGKSTACTVGVFNSTLQHIREEEEASLIPKPRKAFYVTDFDAKTNSRKLVRLNIRPVEPQALIICATTPLMVEHLMNFEALIGEPSTELGKLGVRVAGCYGAEHLSSRQATEMSETQANIIVATPGRLLTYIRLGIIRTTNLKMVVTWSGNDDLVLEVRLDRVKALDFLGNVQSASVNSIRIPPGPAKGIDFTRTEYLTDHLSQQLFSTATAEGRYELGFDNSWRLLKSETFGTPQWKVPGLTFPCSDCHCGLPKSFESDSTDETAVGDIPTIQWRDCKELAHK
ncbi:hypothetical protein NHQ30_009271 [Ciborinia camelliae]|nr:hypothetical protein NHQ30_009271 [Ciborinia camelliae]